MIIEDRGNAGLQALEGAAFAMMGAAGQAEGIAGAFTTFNTRTPRLFADIDRARAEQLGVPVENIFATLGTYLGSSYINDFNFLGRTFRVTAQADAPYRDDISDIGRLRTRSSTGQMVPLDAVMSLRNDSGAYRVVRYNLYRAAELQGDTLPGYSSGQSLDTMEQLARKVLPQGFDFEWTEIAYQQKAAGNTGILVFALGVIFVFLLLAAQYESLVLPLAVILIVPMCLLAAILGVNLMGRDNNILTQIGLVVLIGLAAKNAILIVEFAKHNEDHGQSVLEAARHAAAQRLRPILMTSLAFILGVLPLVISTGPGAEMRQALGIAVFFGMIGVTIFGLLFTPAFYVMVRSLEERIKAWSRRRRKDDPPPAAPASPSWRATSHDPEIPSSRRAALSATLAACTVGPDFERPATPASAAQGFAEGADSRFATAPLPEGWWRLFEDPALDALVTKALQRNTSVREASANLRRARALIREARARQLPSISAQGSANTNQVGTGAMPGCLSYIIAADPTNPDALWITEAWDSKDSHAASLKLPAVQAAIARGRPLIAGFDSRSETTPLGGHGLVKAG